MCARYVYPTYDGKAMIVENDSVALWQNPIQYIPRNMHTVLLCFALLWLSNRSSRIHMKYLSIFFRVALLALGQSLDCHSASEVSLMDMGKSVKYITTTKHSKAKTVCIFLGIYWNCALTCLLMITPAIRLPDKTYPCPAHPRRDTRLIIRVKGLLDVTCRQRR